MSEKRTFTEIKRGLTVAAVSGVMSIGAFAVSQDMSSDYAENRLDCIERFDGDTEQCAPEDLGSDNSDAVETAAYALALLSAGCLIGAGRRIED